MSEQDDVQLQWFKDHKIAVRTEVDATLRGVYVLDQDKQE